MLVKIPFSVIVHGGGYVCMIDLNLLESHVSNVEEFRQST